ncbi:MAG: superoxide dismutase [Chloroflexi bacterium HGW-Chloroflexi-10]|nr:MAG: superoxide dismutase [Chloroflexi bacterium HGW-Chloroflexi-10]
MKIIALEEELPGKRGTDFTPHLQAEAAAVWQLQQAGSLREIYFDSRQHTAVLILEVENLEQAQTLLDSLPLVQAGLIRFKLIPLQPYDGFQRLFAKP